MSQEFRIVDRGGRRISGFDQAAVHELTKGRGMSLPRSALASALYEAVKDRVDVRFGNSVTGLEDSPRGVHVTFRDASLRPSIWSSAPTGSTPPCAACVLVKMRDSNASSDTTLRRSRPQATGSVIRTRT